jgi:putative PIN family toxin of toxin-antitoxin system
VNKSQTSISNMIPVSCNRIVIDTNVCLDLFLFKDPRWGDLLAALESGEVEAVTRGDCRDEWLIVLQYPHLPYDAEARHAGALRFDALIRLLPPIPVSGVRLPVCSDRDDQKFLELARDAGATTLITKDKALLKLGKKTAQAGMFRIIKPEGWQADRAPGTDAARTEH